MCFARPPPVVLSDAAPPSQPGVVPVPVSVSAEDRAAREAPPMEPAATQADAADDITDAIEIERTISDPLDRRRSASGPSPRPPRNISSFRLAAASTSTGASTTRARRQTSQAGTWPPAQASCPTGNGHRRASNPSSALRQLRASDADRRRPKVATMDPAPSHRRSLRRRAERVNRGRQRRTRSNASTPGSADSRCDAVRPRISSSSSLRTDGGCRRLVFS